MKRNDAILREAAALGFSVSMTKNHHLRFDRPGCRAVFFSGTPGDRRAELNGITKLRAAVRGVECSA